MVKYVALRTFNYQLKLCTNPKGPMETLDAVFQDTVQPKRTLSIIGCNTTKRPETSLATIATGQQRH